MYPLNSNVSLFAMQRTARYSALKTAIWRPSTRSLGVAALRHVRDILDSLASYCTELTGNERISQVKDKLKE
jgi:hypothetical protein